MLSNFAADAGADSRFSARALVVLVTALFSCGCGEANPLGRRAVHGAVTFQGKPIDYGAITFQPDDLQNGVSSGAMIEGGKYQIKMSQGLPPGSYQVMISAPDRGARKSGRTARR